MKILMTFKTIFILFALLATSASAQTPSIIELKGKALIHRNGQSTSASLGQVLQLEDTIETLELSSLLLSFGNNAQMRLSPKSIVKIKNLIADSDDEQEVGLFLQLGSLIIDVLADQFPGAIKVQNSNTSFAIRGTTFFTANEDNDVWAAVEHGDVEVNHPSGTEILSSNEGFVVESNQDVSEPKNYEWVKTIDWSNPQQDNFRKNRDQRRKEFKEKRVRWKLNPQRLDRLKNILGRWKIKKQKRLEIRRQRFQSRKIEKNNLHKDHLNRPTRRNRNL